jgi:hypothetical protein
MYFLTYFRQKSGCCATLLTSPFCSVLLLTQTQPRAGEVRSGCAPQSGAAQVIIPIGFRSRAEESVGDGGFVVGRVISLSKWTIGATHLGKFPKPADSKAQ